MVKIITHKTILAWTEAFGGRTGRDGVGRAGDAGRYFGEMAGGLVFSAAAAGVVMVRGRGVAGAVGEGRRGDVWGRGRGGSCARPRRPASSWSGGWPSEGACRYS